MNAKLKKVLLIGIISLVLLIASFASGCYVVYRKMANTEAENIKLKSDLAAATGTIRQFTEAQERERNNYNKLELEYREFKKRYNGEGIIIGTITNANGECQQIIRDIDSLLSEAEENK